MGVILSQHFGSGQAHHKNAQEHHGKNCCQFKIGEAFTMLFFLGPKKKSEQSKYGNEWNQWCNPKMESQHNAHNKAQRKFYGHKI